MFLSGLHDKKGSLNAVGGEAPVVLILGKPGPGICASPGGFFHEKKEPLPHDHKGWVADVIGAKLLADWDRVITPVLARRAVHGKLRSEAVP